VEVTLAQDRLGAASDARERTILWLAPLEGCFQVLFILGDKALVVARQSGLSAQALQALIKRKSIRKERVFDSSSRGQKTSDGEEAGCRQAGELMTTSDILFDRRSIQCACGHRRFCGPP
jgi:hypothetical protein